MNGAGIEKYRQIAVDAICTAKGIDPESAEDILQYALSRDKGIAIDHAYFLKMAEEILAYPPTTSDKIESVRDQVINIVQEFAIDIANEYDSSPGKKKRDSGDVLSQLEEMGFVFDNAVEYERDPDDESEFYAEVLTGLSELQIRAENAVTDFSKKLIGGTPGQADEEHGFNPHSGVYSKFIMDYVTESMTLDRMIQQEAPGIMVAVFAKLFVDAIESGSNMDEYFESHKPKSVAECSKFAIQFTTQHWRKQPMLISAIDLYADLVRETLAPATIVPVVSFLAEFAKFLIDTEDMMPQSAFMDKHLNNLYSAFGRVS